MLGWADVGDIADPISFYRTGKNLRLSLDAV
jgi:hypothetical protein